MGVIKICLLAAVMAWFLVSVSGQQCQSALQAVTNLTNSQTAANVVYQSLTSSTGGACTSRSTCCSPTAERLLRTDSLTRYQSLLSSKLRASISPCVNNNSLAVESANYVVNWKDEMIDLLNIFPQFNTPTLLDHFSNYMSNGIRSLSLPDFRIELQSLFFEIYLRSFKLSIENIPGNAVPNTVSFRQCFYQHLFFPENQEDLNRRYRILQPRLNLLLRFLLALKTSDSVLESIMNHMLSPECGDALLRLTHCKECSGATSSSPPCTPFCQNVLRGCLVDLTEVGHVLQDFATQLEAMKSKLSINDPFAAVDLLTTTVLDMVTNGRNVATQKDMIETTCNVKFSTGSKRRRSITRAEPLHHIRGRRQSNSPDPNAAIGRSVTCAKNVAQAIRSLPEQLCTATGSSTGSCWNGMTVGSYSKALVSPDRLSQVNNSELLSVYPDTGLQYRDAIAQLKNMTAQLTSCSGTLDCAVQLVSLSVPTPSDFALTGPRYVNISRPVVTSIPVSTTVFNPSTTQHLSTTASHHFLKSSTRTLSLTSIRLTTTISSTTRIMVEPSITTTTTSSIAEPSITAAAAMTSSNIPQASLNTAAPSLVPSRSSQISTSFAFTESASFTELLFTPAASSSSLIPHVEPSSSHLPEISTGSSGYSESSSLDTQQVTSEAVPLCSSSTPAPPESNTNIAPTSQPNTAVSSLLLGVFAAGWALLLLSLVVNFILIVVVMKDKKRPATDKICNTSVQANGISAVYANGNGKAFTDISAEHHYIEESDIVKKSLSKKPASTPRVLYQPKYSINPVTTV